MAYFEVNFVFTVDVVLAVGNKQFQLGQRVGPENHRPHGGLGFRIVHAPQPHFVEVWRRLHQNRLEPYFGKRDGSAQLLLDVTAVGLTVTPSSVPRPTMIEFGAARNLRDTVDLCCPVGVIYRRCVLKESPKKRTQVVLAVSCTTFGNK